MGSDAAETTTPSQGRQSAGWMRLPYAALEGRSAAIGVLTLASDIATEAEFRAFLPADGVGIHAARIPRAKASTLANLQTMERHITEAVERLVPDDDLDVIAFSCTSGTAAIGATRVVELIRNARPGIAVTDPLTAVQHGLTALGIRRIALLTPYQAAVNTVMLEEIERGGFEVVAKAGFFCESGYEMSRIAPESIFDAALALGRRDDVDGVLISCTALRVAKVIAKLESTLGKAVVFSTQAMAWQAARLCGLDKGLPERGRLMRL